MPDAQKSFLTPLLPKSGLLSNVVAYYGVKALSRYKNGTSVVDSLQSEITKMFNTSKIKSIHSKAHVSDLPRLNAITAPKAAIWMVPPPSGIRYPTDSTMIHAHRLRLGLNLEKSKQLRKCVCGFHLKNYSHFVLQVPERRRLDPKTQLNCKSCCRVHYKCRWNCR